MSTKRPAHPTALSVLVVEDEVEISDLIRFHLQRAGYDATACPSGKRALELVKTHPPRAVLLDLMLPDLPGLEVCRRLRGGRNSDRSNHRRPRPGQRSVDPRRRLSQQPRLDRRHRPPSAAIR